ncbi:MAG TPA: pyridoxamine 5'-phosphate oxidase family protein [Microbacteriaceae bacterium]|nr:pyridoxamine 5'-phosphate oxidase family protein [Microbacteriaceae bacterium]
MSPVKRVIESLSEHECWALVAAANLGRIAVTTDDGVDIFPVNYLVSDRAVLFRSAPGSKLVNLIKRPTVAFEVDDTHSRRTLWSVVVKGTAQRLGFDSDIEESGVLGLQSLNPTEKWNYIRIIPQSITGRRFVGPRRTSRR